LSAGVICAHVQGRSSLAAQREPSYHERKFRPATGYVTAHASPPR